MPISQARTAGSPLRRCSLVVCAVAAGRHVVWSVAAMVAGSLVWLVGIEWPFGLQS